MESKKSGKAKVQTASGVVPPSLAPHPVWTMMIEVSSQDVPTLMMALQPRAQSLLGRKKDGGTDDTLRCLCCFLSRAPQLAQIGSTVEEPAASSTEQIELPQHQAAPKDAQLQIVLIIDGNGRLKSSVLRSLRTTLFEPGCWQGGAALFANALLRTLQARDLASALHLQRTCSVSHVIWADAEFGDLPAYLIRRMNREGTTSSTDKVQMGLDLLGPKRRAPLQPPMPPMKMLKGPAGERPSEPSEPQEPSRGPDPNMVRACAMFVAQKGEVTQEQAEAALKQLLLDLHDTTEELHKAKLELSFYKERDALHSQVHMLSFSHLTRVLCHSSHVCPSFRCLLCGADNDTSGLDNGYTPSTTPRP